MSTTASEKETELRIDRDCRVRLRCGGELAVCLRDGYEEEAWPIIPAGVEFVAGCAWRRSGEFAPYDRHPLDIVAIIDEPAGESEAELAARHAGQENGGDEEEPSPEPIADLITGPGRYVCRNDSVGTVTHYDNPDDEEDDCNWVGSTSCGVKTSWTDAGRFAVSDHAYDLIAPIPASLSDAEAADYAKRYAPLYAEAIGQGKTPEQAREYARERVEKKAEPVVIDGPGDYRTANGSLAVIDRYEPDVLANRPWAGYVIGDPDPPRDGRRWAPDGTRGGGGYEETFRIVSKVDPQHVPAPEPPKLQEPLCEGEWWGIDSEGSRVKVRVYKTACTAPWFFAIDEQSADDPWRGFIEDDGTCHGGDLQLIRPVRPPRVEPYTSDEDKGAMFGKTVRRKSDGAERRIRKVEDDRVEMEQGAFPRWSLLATEFEHLDGSPCGVIEGSDPWDEPTG